MNDHKDESLSSILPVATNKTKKSGGLHSPKNIRAKVRASNLSPSSKLNGRPVFGCDESCIAQPLGDGLLTKRRAVHERGNLLGKGGLASGQLNRDPKGSNVVFLSSHIRRDYTTKIVAVNDFSRVRGHNELCSVVDMSTGRPFKPRAASQERPEPALRGPDGLTLGDRLKLGMAAKAHQLRAPYQAKDLLAEANRVAGRGPDDEPVLTQQALSRIMTNKVSESSATPAFAVALGLNALWLQYGVGPRSYIETLENLS